MSGPDIDKLETAMASYGRNARALSAALLQVYPDILKALFGDEAYSDVTKRQALAEDTEAALRRIVAKLPNADRPIGEVIWVTRPEFHGLTVTQRLQGLYIDNRFKERRRTIIKLATAELWRTLGPGASMCEGPVLTPQAHRAARQLYRYAQMALVVIEAFDHCSEMAQTIRVQFEQARRGKTGFTNIRHAWLEPHSDLKRRWGFHLIPHSRSYRTDSGLWAYAYFRRYLRDLLADVTGRDYLREILPADCWGHIQKGAPFGPAEVDRMIQVLANTQVDNSSEFVNDLCGDCLGQAIHDKWLQLLTLREWRLRPGQATGAADRSSTSRYLLMLCVSMQGMFPDETDAFVGDRYESIVRGAIRAGLKESLGLDLGGDRVHRDNFDLLANDVLGCRPPRYVKVIGRRPEWNDELGDSQKYPPWFTE